MLLGTLLGSKIAKKRDIKEDIDHEKAV